MFKIESLYVISAVSLLEIGTSIDVNMLLTCYWSHLKTQGLANYFLWTQRTMWKYIHWDLEA